MRGKLGCWLAVLLGVVAGSAGAQTGSAKADPFAALEFLRGTWEAKATGPDGVAVNGRYAFVPELDGTVLARHSTTDPACQGPATFDCAHSDLFYVFADTPGGPLKAIYFDREGHVIHYGVTAPSATVVEFLSEAAGPGPQFRLRYELKGGVMRGGFQMRMPGTEAWQSYLEWSGARVAAK